MENKEKAKEMPSVQLDKDNDQYEYQFLIRKLKRIKESINLLEEIFFEKEK